MKLSLSQINITRLIRKFAKSVRPALEKATKADRTTLADSNDQRRRAIAEVTRFAVRLIGGLAALAFLWTMVSRFVVHPLIERAYRGESLPFLNSIISGQAQHTVERYLADWNLWSWRLLGMVVVIALFALPLATTGTEVQRYFESRYASRLALYPCVANTTISLLGLALVFYLYYLQPVSYVYLIAEDYWAEYGSFVAWGMAFCFLACVLFKNHAARKPALMLLAIGVFFVALEEISWGQRIVGFGTPTLMTDYNLQGETNVHNLVRWPVHKIAGIAVLLWVVLLPILTTQWQSLLRWCSKLGIPIVSKNLWPFFLLAIFFLIFFPVLKSDEIGELFLGFAMATLSLDLVRTARRSGQPPGAPAIAATAGMILVMGILTIFLVQFYSTPSQLTYRLNQFAANHFPNAGMYRQAETVFDYIDQNPQFLEPETLFQHGVLLMQMGKDIEARNALEYALIEQERFEKKMPGNPIPFRVTGQVLTLLKRDQEADAAFLRAVESDKARLDRAKNPVAEARIRLSLGQTFLAQGDIEAAIQQLSRARALAPDRRTRFKLDAWIRQNLGQEVFVKLTN